MNTNENRVFGSKLPENDQIIIAITAGSIKTTYVWEAPHGALVTDKVWKITRVIDDSTITGTKITTIGIPLIDGIYESNGWCIRDDSWSNTYDNYTYSR